MFQLYAEHIGLIASFTILIALLMSSIKKLRIINFFGSILMVFYGILILKFPVIIMNIGTALINVYFLRQMFLKREYFSLITVEKESEYLDQFITFYQKNLPDKMQEKDIIERSTNRFFILRNMIPAGLFIVTNTENETLEIELDFVTPAYRDFKVAEYVYHNIESDFYRKGYKQFLTHTKNEKHIKYLKRMNFEETMTDKGIAYIKKMVPSISNQKS